MSDLSEADIKQCLAENLRLASSDARLLSILPAKGKCYERFRNSLKLVEGSCRQLAYFREDARWLEMGILMEDAHQRVRRWVVGHGQPELFRLMSEKLSQMEIMANQLRDKATGRTGMILPGGINGRG